MTRRRIADSINNTAKEADKVNLDLEMELFRSSRPIASLWLSASLVYIVIPAPASNASRIAIH
jgi:hypothetical protein